MSCTILRELANECGIFDADVKMLMSSGIRTAEEVHSLLCFDRLVTGPRRERRPTLGRPDALTKYLSNRYLRYLQSPPRPRPLNVFGAVGSGGEFENGGTGTIPPPTEAPVRLATLHGKSKLMWSPPFWNVLVREQGGTRGACVAHAAAACCEFAAYKANRPTDGDLSEQFLQWAIKTKTTDPRHASDGTKLKFAHDALMKVGICSESSCRYDPTISDMLQFTPSPAAIDEAKRTKFPDGPHLYLDKPITDAAATLYEWLGDGPAAVALPIFADPLDMQDSLYYTNWTLPAVEVGGVVLDKPQAWVAVPDSGHCVCVVGFEPDKNERSGGYFIFRNSWGPDWAEGHLGTVHPHVPQAGYGAISATQIENHTWEMLRLSLPS